MKTDVDDAKVIEQQQLWPLGDGEKQQQETNIGTQGVTKTSGHIK